MIRCPEEVIHPAKNSHEEIDKMEILMVPGGDDKNCSP